LLTVIFKDTDSIIFVSRPGEYEPEVGENLGDWASELGPDEHIVEFCSTGAKSYGYTLNTGETEAKCKGITFSASASEIINYKSMKLVVTEDQSQALTVEQFKFGRDTSNWSIFTYVQKKIFRFTFDKRAINELDLTTTPFGY
jgi:hypothetical protein